MHERPWNRERRAWNAGWFCPRRMNRIRQGSKIHSSPHSTHSLQACQYAVCTLPCMLLRKTQPRWFANQTIWFLKSERSLYTSSAISYSWFCCELVLLSYWKHNVCKPPFEIALFWRNLLDNHCFLNYYTYFSKNFNVKTNTFEFYVSYFNLTNMSYFIFDK